MDTKRLVPLSGIAFVALIVLSLAVGGSTPASGASADEVASFYGDDLSRQSSARSSSPPSAPLVVLFGVGLASAVAERDRPLVVGGTIVRAGAILVAAAVLLAAGIHMAIVDGGDNGISEDRAAGAQRPRWQHVDRHDERARRPLARDAPGRCPRPAFSECSGWSAPAPGVALFLPDRGLPRDARIRTLDRRCERCDYVKTSGRRGGRRPHHGFDGVF